MKENRDETIILRLSKTEKNRIYKKMLTMGIHSLSAYIRKMALDGLSFTDVQQQPEPIYPRSPPNWLSLSTGRRSFELPAGRTDRPRPADPLPADGAMSISLQLQL